MNTIEYKRAIIIAIDYFEYDFDKRNLLKRSCNKKLIAKLLEAAKACSIDNRPCTIKDIINLEFFSKIR